MRRLLVDVVKHGEDRTSLIAFPPAGAGVGFLAGWADILAPAMDFAVVRLPGREDLFEEPPMSDLGEILTELHAEISGRGEHDLILYGACTGALLAYELAHRMRRTGEPQGQPVMLAVSNAPTPDMMVNARMHAMPTPELKEYYMLGEEGDYPDELWQMAEPRIRADLASVEHTGYTMEPLDVPIVAIRGADDTILPRDYGMRWERYTRAGFTLTEIPGNHFLMLTSSDRMAEELAALARAPRAA